MFLRVGSNFGEPGAGNHDAGGCDGLLVQSIEARRIHGMCHGKIVGVNDQEFRISRVAQPLRDGLGLRLHIYSGKKDGYYYSSNHAHQKLLLVVPSGRAYTDGMQMFSSHLMICKTPLE